MPCPHCGPRNVSEFRYHGEESPRPDPNADQALDHIGQDDVLVDRVSGREAIARTKRHDITS